MLLRAAERPDGFESDDDDDGGGCGGRCDARARARGPRPRSVVTILYAADRLSGAGVDILPANASLVRVQRDAAAGRAPFPPPNADDY